MSYSELTHFAKGQHLAFRGNTSFLPEYEIANNDSVGSPSPSSLANVTSGLHSADDGCVEFQFVLNTVVIGVLCLFGFAGNTLAIVILHSDRNNRVAVFLLQALAIADNSVLCVSFIILSLFYGLLPEIGCPDTVTAATPYFLKYVNPIGYVVQSCSIWIAVLLAVNRYVAICRPYAAARWLTMRRARIQVAIVVAVSIALNVPRIFIIDIINGAADSTVNGTADQHLWHYSTLGLNVYFEMIYLNAFYTSVVLILPLLLLVGLNLGLARSLQASKRRMQLNSISYVGQSENGVTVVMVAIVLELVLCHTPDRVVQIIHYWSYIAFPDESRLSACPSAIFYAVNISNLLIIFSSATDFIIYFVFRRRFRAALIQRFQCADRRHSVISECNYRPTGRASNGQQHRDVHAPVGEKIAMEDRLLVQNNLDAKSKYGVGVACMTSVL